MTERDFSGLEGALQQAGDEVAVGTPPTGAMLQKHRRRQRRRTVAAGSVLAVTVGGLALVAGQGIGSHDDQVAALPQAQGQWVGMRHVAVDVGNDWTQGRACDEGASVDTYDVTGFRYVDSHCAGANPSDQEQRTRVSFTPFGDDVDPARMAQAPGRSGTSPREIEIDGHRVLRSEIRCIEVGERTSANGNVPQEVRTCSAALAVPDEGVSLSVWSKEGEQKIEELLDSVRIFENHAAVPSPYGELEEYRAEATRLGLQLEAVTPLGRKISAADVVARVTEVGSAPGTFIRSGSTVKVEAREVDGESSELVGLGHVAVSVPPSWPVGAISCGVPEEDTYSIEGAGSVSAACGGFWSQGRTWVQLSDGERPPRDVPSGWSEATVEGSTAWVQPVQCEPADGVGSTPFDLCSASVWFPGEGVKVTVRSTVDGDTVQRRLETVRVMPGEVGVPPYAGFFNDHQERSGEKYVEHLESLGFRARTISRHREGLRAGYVLGVEGVPVGLMLDPGATLDVIVSSGK